MKKEIAENEYAVLRDTEYYQGNCNHPLGWSLRIESIADEWGNEIPCRGTLEECQEWLETLNSKDIYLSNGECSHKYRIVEILEHEITYEEWLHNSYSDYPEDMTDEQEQCLWAENQAYKNDAEIAIQDENYKDILVNLSPKIN